MWLWCLFWPLGWERRGIVLMSNDVLSIVCLLTGAAIMLVGFAIGFMAGVYVEGNSNGKSQL